MGSAEVWNLCPHSLSSIAIASFVSYCCIFQTGSGMIEASCCHHGCGKTANKENVVYAVCSKEQEEQSQIPDNAFPSSYGHFEPQLYSLQLLFIVTKL